MAVNCFTTAALLRSGSFEGPEELLDGNLGDVGIGALVPVQEALDVHGVADVQGFDGVVDVGGVVAQVGLHAEVIGLAVDGGVEVQVVAVLAGAVPVVEEGDLVAVGIGGGLDGQALEGDELVHVVDESCSK